MPRIRTVKPEFWSSESLSSVSETAVILAVALLNYADDEGYFNAHPKLVRAFAFPIREPNITVTESMQELASIGYITIFKTDAGKNIGLVEGLTTHQRISKPKSSTYRALTDRARIVCGQGVDKAREEGKGREQGKEGNTSSPGGDGLGAQAWEADFLTFWEAYPRKLAKTAARKAFLARCRSKVKPADMVVAARNYAKECQAEGRESGVVLHAATFVGPKLRFEDYTKGVPNEQGFRKSSLDVAKTEAAKRKAEAEEDARLRRDQQDNNRTQPKGAA